MLTWSLAKGVARGRSPTGIPICACHSPVKRWRVKEKKKNRIRFASAIADELTDVEDDRRDTVEVYHGDVCVLSNSATAV